MLSDHTLTSLNVSEGLISFTDSINRTLHVGFRLVLDGNEETINVVEAQFAMPVSSRPAVDFLLVPTSTLDQYSVIATKDYVELYKALSNKSVNPDNQSIDDNNFIAVIFYKNILPPKTSIGMKLSNSPEGIDGDGSQARYKLFDNHWLVTLMPVEISLARSKQWIKVTIVGDGSVYDKDLSKEQLIDKFAIGSGA